MNLKRFLILGNILLSGLIIWVGVSIVTTWVSNGRAGDSTSSVPSKMSMPKGPTSSTGKRLEDYALITAKDVFHTTKETPKTAGKEYTEGLKETELSLELTGTVVGEGKGSFAFIVDKGSGQEEVYLAGDYVMGAQIVRVMKDRVILNVGGSEETLPMVSLEGKKTPVTRLATPPQRSLSTPPQTRPATPPATPQRRIITPRRGEGTASFPPPQ